MNIEVIKRDFSICKLKTPCMSSLTAPFCFYAVTDEEISLVCPSELVPENAAECDGNWKAFRVSSILDFSLVGILSELSGILAENGISIFAVSTFNTDYILIKTGSFERALSVLSEAGHIIIR